VIFNVQVVFDCVDPDKIMQFWGRALQYENDTIDMTLEQMREWRKDYPQYDGRGRIDDATARRMPVYIQKVPEPKAVRNRLRPEIAVRDDALDATLNELRAHGASGSGAELTDVEGNEFTVVGGLERGDVDRVLRSVVFDCADPDRMLEFWSAATGYDASGNRCDPQPGLRTFKDGFLFVDEHRIREMPWNPRAAEGEVFDLVPGLAFVKTGEPKRTKNRLHIDLWNTAPETNRDRMLKLGATIQRWDEEHVMLDPEGNEFCAG
jgi:hypothetical protein